MTRCLTVFAAALAVLIPLADTAEAQLERTRGVGVLRIGPIEFRTGARPFARLERRNVIVSRSVARPFPYADFDAVEVFPFAQGESGHWQLPHGDHARARQLDEDLGRALEDLRRDLARREQPVFPQTFDAPQGGAVEVTRLPETGAQPAAPGVIIEEAEVLGLVPLLGDAPTTSSPVTSVSTASAADVATYGAAAFAPLTHPASMGLPEGPRYFVLNGKVVTLDAEAERALTVAALEAALQ